MLHEVGTGRREEARPGLAGERLGEQRIAGPGWAVKEEPRRHSRADAGEASGVAQERHELADLLDSLIAAGHVGEPHGWPPGAVAAGRRTKPPPTPCPEDIGSQSGKDGKGAQERQPWVAASLLSLFDASPGVREPVREIALRREGDPLLAAAGQPDGRFPPPRIDPGGPDLACPHRGQQVAVDEGLPVSCGRRHGCRGDRGRRHQHRAQEQREDERARPYGYHGIPGAGSSLPTGSGGTGPSPTHSTSASSGAA